MMPGLTAHLSSVLIVNEMCCVYARFPFVVAAKHVAVACLFLAAKVEEEARRLRNVLNVCRHVLYTFTKSEGSPPLVEPLELGTDTYHRYKNEVIRAERRLLKNLGFCVHLDLPYKLLLCLQKLLGLQEDTDLTQIAWNFMNDALRTEAFVRFNGDTVACACVQLGCKQQGIELTQGWSSLFEVIPEECDAACQVISEQYTWKTKPNWALLQTVLAKKALAERS
eukprot:m.9336 g.9336  ORF g.9336 m.9336 type:complete len:224 (+) comp5442_c0_seq1:533-1204(+)